MDNQNHYSNLETLRGLAALMVAVSHSFVALTFGGIDKLWGRPVWTIPLESIDAFFAGFILVFANGSAAVVIFFILSGVVLGLSLDSSSNHAGLLKRYGIFLFKRIFRIYPAHVFSIIFVCIVLIIFGIINPGDFEKSSIWYNWFYNKTPDLEMIIRNLVLLDVSLNPITWTLKVELIVALLFPLLHLISRVKCKQGPLLQVSVLSSLILLSIANPGGGGVLPHVYKFYLGLLIPIYGPILSTLTKQYFNLANSKILLLAVVLVLIENQLVLAPYQAYGLVQTFGASLLVYTLMHSSGGWLFRLQVLKRLGQYSFSFYLWHFPILWFMYYALHTNRFTQDIIFSYTFTMASFVCLASVSLAYLISSVSYWVIEHRMILLGRKLIPIFWK